MNTLLATIKSTSGTKDGVGSFQADLSVPTLDRDKEVVDPGAFAPLPEHITIDIDHAMSVEKTVGSGRPFYGADGVLRFKGTYASTPLAQMVRTLVDEGHIRTMSVAYMDSVYEVGDDGLKHLRKAELLNAGIVGIAANREALITASKALVTEVIDAAVVPDALPGAGGSYAAALRDKSGARHSTQDLKLLQTAHDALAALGVTCAAKASPTGDETTTDSDEKAPSDPADKSAPAEPAGPRVDVATAKARASAARASLALL